MSDSKNRVVTPGSDVSSWGRRGMPRWSANDRTVAAAAGPAALLVLVLVALHAPSCARAQTWDFRNVTDKATAVAMARSDSLLPLLKNKSLSPAAASQLTSMFQDWAAHFNKSFSPLQLTEVLYNFKTNMQLVYLINSNSSLPYWASGNRYSHLTWDRFKTRALGKTPSGSSGRRLLHEWGAAHERRVLASVPAEVDWVQAGKVTDVKDQQRCAASWAFAATAAVESMHLIQVPGLNRSQVLLSEQELIDCCDSDHGCPTSNGCVGGLSNEGINFVWSLGQSPASIYPYTSGALGRNGSCGAALLWMQPEVQLAGKAVHVPAKSEVALMQAVSITPTVIYFDAESRLQFYAGGVFTDPSCSTKRTDHAMVAVGYSTSGNQSYWIVRNSWSADWGEAGYVRVAMTGDTAGMCGMYLESYQPPSKFSRSLESSTMVPSPPSPIDACACVFPFIYKKKTYTTCTTTDDTRAWCIVSPGCNSNDGTLSSSTPPDQPWVYCPTPPSPPSPVPPPPPASPCACLQRYVYNGSTYTGGSCAAGASAATAGASICLVSSACEDFDGTTQLSTPPGQLYRACTPSPPPQPPSPPYDPCDCTFPFVYRNLTYLACTAVEDTEPWCLVSPGCTRAPGTLRYSTPPYLPYMYCNTPTPAASGTVPCQCFFPFEYKGRSYSNCTTADSPGRPWCPVDTSGGAVDAPDALPDYPSYFYDYPGTSTVCHADGTIYDLTDYTSRTSYVYC